MRYVVTIVLMGCGLCAAVVGTGCKAKPTEASGPYKTLGQDLRRDTEKAKEQNSRAIALIKSGKYAEAEPILKAALEADVTYGPAHNNLGKCYFKRGEMYLAAWEFQYAANLMPDHAEPRNNLGLVFESVGKLDDAVTWYDAALRMGSDSAEYLGNAARARLTRGDRDTAVRDLLEKLVLRETRPEWLEWAREALARMGSAPASQPAS